MCCDKKALTKTQAIAALGIIKSKRNNRKADHRPCRKYYCKDCNTWHLTSTPLNQFYQYNKHK